MREKWQSVYSSENEHRSEIVLHILEDKGMNPVIVRTKDSSYNNFGYFKILVAPEDVLESIRIITDEIKFE